MNQSAIRNQGTKSSFFQNIDGLATYKALLMPFCGLIFFLIALGGTVRNMGAGLSCPDWPLCFGKFLPHFDAQIFVEYFHRVTASVVSFINLGLAIYAFRKPELRNVRFLFVMSILILFGQVILGGLTVLKLLQGEIVTLHLAIGTLYFLTLLWIAKRSLNTETSGTKSTLWKLNVAALCVLFTQMVIGGVVSSHHAGLACPDFPTCLGEWWPNYGGLVAIHFTHRLGAFVTTILFISFLVVGYRHTQLNAESKKKLNFILLALIAQVLLGIGNVIFSIPVSVGVLHLAMAQTLFALTFTSAYDIYYQKLR